MPQAIKPAQRFYQFIRHFPAISLKMSFIIGSQSSTPRGAIFHSEEEVRSDSIYRFLSINNSVASPDYMLVVNQGFLAIKAQLEDRMRSLLVVR